MIIRDRFYIDGAWVTPVGTGTLEVIDASTEEVMGRVPDGVEADPQEDGRDEGVQDGVRHRGRTDGEECPGGAGGPGSICTDGSGDPSAGAVGLLSLQLSVSDVRQKTATRRWIPLSLAAAIAVGVCAAVVTDLPFKARFELSKPALNDLASRDIIDDREQCVNFYCFNFIDSDNGEFVAELSITGESSLTWTRAGVMRGSDPPKSPRYSDVIDMGDDWYYFGERD